MDDTLLVTSKVKWEQHKFVAKHYFDIDITDSQLREHWGKPFAKLTDALYQGISSPEQIRHHYLRHELEYAKTYQPEALSSIKRLHDSKIVLGLITSMDMEDAMIELLHLKFPLDSFIILQGSESTNYHKPDGRVFDPALATLRARHIKGSIVYVGDALMDCLAARSAGLDFFGVTLGFTTRKEFT